MGINIMEALRRVTHAIAKKIPNSLTVEGNMLYLAKDFVPISDGVEIQVGSGGGGGSGFISLSNRLPSTRITTPMGSSVKLIFAYASSEDEEAGGTAYIYVNNISKGTFSINRGINEIEITEFLGAGINEVKLTCVDAYSNSKSLSYSVNLIDLHITSTFDDSQVYSGDIIVRYVPVGAIEKTIHIVVDGKDNTIVTSETGKQQSYTIPAMSHGAHALKIYMSADVNGSSIISNELVYDILCIETGKTDSMISSAYNVTSIIQGELVNIPFTIYDPVNMTTQVTLTVSKDGEVYSSTERSVDRTRQIWSLRDYPIGNITFTITCGNISKSHTVKVIESSVNIFVKETDMEFQLKSAGKSNADGDRNIWENNGVTTTFENINWDSTGWINDEYGDVALRLSGEAKATIDFKPFEIDARNSGRTIEIEFAIRDVNNRDAVAISCLKDGVGFTVTADTATFMSEQSKIKCNYSDDTKVHIAFVVEPKTDYRLMMVYLNGVLSGSIQYPENDNLQQSPALNIAVGSPYCSIDLYCIRSYNTALTMDEVRDNYIADITDVSKKLALIADNDIYDVYGKISFSKIQSKIPVLIVTGELPKAKGDKKDVVVTWTDPNNPQFNYEDTGKIDVQGTSSQYYIRKNYKIKFKNNYHQTVADEIPTNVFTFKADYAEATSTHNTGSANYIDVLYGDIKTPPQGKDERIRKTIYGFPCVIFHRADASSELEFIGKYNCNSDKGSLETYGFTDEYPDVESWEFLNNTSDACLFHGEISDTWIDDFEARYPEDYEDISAFKTMHDWVVSTWQNGATGDILAETYTSTDGTTYANDTAEYRLAKFKKEFTEHFDFDFCLFYYIFTFVMLMVDQRAKNMFLTTWDKVHWQPWFYDNDQKNF